MTAIKLSEWCERTGVSYNTAWRWVQKGAFPAQTYQTSSGAIMVEDDNIEQTDTTNKALSLFLTKTVEHIKNNSSIEEFAAFVIANFQLRLNTPEIKSIKSTKAPRIKTQDEQSQDARTHFQQQSPFSQEKEASLREAKIKLKAGQTVGDMVPASAFNDSLLIDPLFSELAELTDEKDSESSK
jgi:hypothetical protein